MDNIKALDNILTIEVICDADLGMCIRNIYTIQNIIDRYNEYIDWLKIS